MAIPRPKRITGLEAKEILSLQREDITMEKIRDFFACHMGQDNPKYNTYDIIKLPAGRLYNKEELETTIGRFICNLVMFPESYLKKYGYNNKPLDKDELEDIEGKMGQMILNDEMSTKEYGLYLDNGEWIGMGTAYFLSPTMNYEINVPIKEVIEKRDELFEKYKEGVKRGDSAVAEKIEKEVLALAK